MYLTGAQKFDNLCKKNSPIWMGIINLTPDSFSDGGNFQSNEKALKRALELVQNGAQILDFGGVSTRPFSELIEPEIELQRVYKTIFNLKKQLPSDILISIDSFSPYVVNVLARDGLIDIINDQFSARCEEEITYESTLKKRNTAQIAGQYELGYIIMHMQGAPGTMQVNPIYEDCGKEVLSFLKERILLIG